MCLCLICLRTSDFVKCAWSGLTTRLVSWAYKWSLTTRRLLGLSHAPNKHRCLPEIEINPNQPVFTIPSRISFYWFNEQGLPSLATCLPSLHIDYTSHMSSTVIVYTQLSLCCRLIWSSQLWNNMFFWTFISILV